MSTRSLVMVVVDKQVKIAQYGDSDGYPSVEGLSVLEFLNQIKKQKAKVLNKIKRISFLDDQEFDQIQKNQNQRSYPELQLNGGEILHYLLDHEVKKIADSSEFAKDNMFCEWCYVIDFDTKTYEVYRGFNQEPLTEADRFYDARFEGCGFYPAKMVKSFALKNLPSENEFLDSLNQ